MDNNFRNIGLYHKTILATSIIFFTVCNDKRKYIVQICQSENVWWIIANETPFNFKGKCKIFTFLCSYIMYVQ